MVGLQSFAESCSSQQKDLEACYEVHVDVDLVCSEGSLHAPMSAGRAQPVTRQHQASAAAHGRGIWMTKPAPAS